MASPKEAACQQQAMKQQHADKHNKSFTAGGQAKKAQSPRAAQKHHSTTKSEVKYIVFLCTPPPLRPQLTPTTFTFANFVRVRSPKEEGAVHELTVMWSTATEALCVSPPPVKSPPMPGSIPSTEPRCTRFFWLASEICDAFLAFLASCSFRFRSRIASLSSFSSASPPEICNGEVGLARFLAVFENLNPQWSRGQDTRRNRNSKDTDTKSNACGFGVSFLVPYNFSSQRSRTALPCCTVLVRTNKSARPRFPHTVDQYPPSFVNVEFDESR